MNSLNHRLNHLLRLAALARRNASEASSRPEPPFGFETRVLAALAVAGQSAERGVLGAVFRHSLACSLALLCLSVGLSYHALADFSMAVRLPDMQAARLADRRTVSASLDFAR